MLTIIILGWILSQMATPTIIWACYSSLCVIWVLNSLFQLIVKLTE